MSYLVFDIESEAYPFSLLKSVVPPFDPDAVKVGNRADPAKIAAYIDQQAASYWEDISNNAALDPTTATVLAIGLLSVSPGGEAETLIHPDDGFAVRTERAMLEEFWGRLQGPHGSLPQLVGFNCNGFDLPFLVKRSWALGVRVAPTIRQGRYWDAMDVMEAWTMGDRQQRISLDRMARHFGLGGKVGSGKNFAPLYKQDKPAALDYLRQDLQLTKLCAQKMGIIPTWAGQ